MATLNVSTNASEWTGTVPTLWEESMFEVSTRKSISDQLSGDEQSGAAILDKTDLTKRAGDTVTFTTIDPLLGEPVSGRTTLEGSEEDTQASTFSVTVTHYRHGTATDELAEILSIVGRKWDGLAARLIGDWFGRRKDDDWMAQTLVTDTIQTLYAGGVTTRNDIAPGSYLLPHELRRGVMAAERRGATPFKDTKGFHCDFPIYGALMSEVDYYHLVNSADFKQDARLASVRGRDNAAITGAQADMYQGCLILKYASRPANTGFYGTYLRPEARLRTALTAGATTLDIGPATVKTGVDYGKYFSQTGSSQLLLVESENISYTGGASDPGNSSWATVSRAANGTTAVTHAAGSLVTQNNLGRVLIFGKAVTCRAWALKPRRKKQMRDYEFEKGQAIQWIYGLESVQWSDSTVANAISLETYSSNPNTV